MRKPKKVSQKRVRDRDLIALGGSLRALRKSSCGRMLRANLDFLWDHFVAHPPAHVLTRFYGKNYVSGNAGNAP